MWGLPEPSSEHFPNCLPLLPRSCCSHLRDSAYGDCVLFSAGKERRGLAELCTGLQSAPREIRKKCMFRSVGDFALTKLLPHLGCRVGQDWIDERGNYADGLGGRCQHACLKSDVIRLRAVGRLLPGSVGGEIAVGFGNEGPEGFQRLREIQLIEGRRELGNRACRAFAQCSLILRSLRPLPARLRRSICAPCSRRG